MLSIRRPATSSCAIAFAFAVAVSSAQDSGPRSVVLPFSEQESWQVLQYKGIPAHRIRFSQTGLEMTVDGSAMPLIYPLPERLRVGSIRIKGRVQGAVRIPPGRQGEEKFDDYVFRIGLVEDSFLQCRRRKRTDRAAAPASVER